MRHDPQIRFVIPKAAARQRPGIRRNRYFAEDPTLKPYTIGVAVYWGGRRYLSVVWRKPKVQYRGLGDLPETRGRR